MLRGYGRPVRSFKRKGAAGTWAIFLIGKPVYTV